MILGYDKLDWQECGIKNKVNIILPRKTSNILIAGKSGSGKSQSCRWYVWQLLKENESLVYLADYKAGEEYEPFDGSVSYASGESALELIDKFYQFFTKVRQNKIHLEHHVTLFVEEWFGLVSYAESQSKKMKAELLARMGEILAVARGLNLGVMLAVQRADASLFDSGSREQFQAVVCFGRCSAEQFRMLGFSYELEENPTVRYDSGQGLVLIDGRGVREIIVPWIENQEEMCRQIRARLDSQPPIDLLIEATTNGGGFKR